MEQMRRLEERAVESGIALDQIMEAAGLSVARRIAQRSAGIRGARVMVLVGPGNNGGDGMVVARYLSDWGALVTLYMTASRRRQDRFEECRSRRIRVVEGQDDRDHWALSNYLPLTDVVVDAVLGIGQTLPLEADVAALLRLVGQFKRLHPGLTLVAVDVPTGVHADTGAVDDAVAPVDLTVTLGAPKLGLLRFPAASWVGELATVDIGLPHEVTEEVGVDLATDGAVRTLLPERPLDSHKGTFGHVLVVAGSGRYVGASVLTSAAAYRIGAGLVTLAAPYAVYRIAASQLPEATHMPLADTVGDGLMAGAARDVREALQRVDAGVIGPGLGASEPVRRLLRDVLTVEPYPAASLVLDADALNCLADTYQWWQRLRSPVVLTPHPGEMARLLRIEAATVQADRLELAHRAAETWGHVVVLKGPYTVVAAPGGRATISPFANPALASGGTGDVLAGVIGGLLAQGLYPYEAAVAGVHAHGLAGQRVRSRLGDAGLMASDLLLELPLVLNGLRAIR